MLNGMGGGGGGMKFWTNSLPDCMFKIFRCLKTLREKNVPQLQTCNLLMLMEVFDNASPTPSPSPICQYRIQILDAKYDLIGLICES